MPCIHLQGALNFLQVLEESASIRTRVLRICNLSSLHRSFDSNQMAPHPAEAGLPAKPNLIKLQKNLAFVFFPKEQFLRRRRETWLSSAFQLLSSFRDFSPKTFKT